MNKYLKAALFTGGLFFILFLGWLQLNRIYTTEVAPVSFEVVSFLEKNSFTKLPGIAFTDLDDRPIDIEAKTKGKITIVNFWATWCEPCAQEFPSMVKLLKDYPNEVVFLAVSHDTKKDDITTFAKAFSLDQSPNLLMSWDQGLRNSRIFEVNKLPESYIFDKNGILLKKVVGTRNWYDDDARAYFKIITAAP